MINRGSLFRNLALNWYDEEMQVMRKIRYIWIGILGTIVLSLLYVAIVPFGEISYQTDFSKYYYFISDFSPLERLQANAQKIKRIIVSEPVYFFVRPPRAFETVAVTAHFTNPASLIEIGICRDQTAWNFERQPFYFEKLEQLVKSQNTLIEKDLILWQKEKKYDSISDFIKNPPRAEDFALYNFNITPSLLLPDYTSLPEPKMYSLGIRGNYILLTYSNGDPIEMNFSLKNTSDSKTSQTVTFNLYNTKNEVIESEKFNFPLNDQQPNLIFEKKIKTKNLIPGAYRLEFIAGNDFVTENVTTTQSRLAFLNRLWLTDASRTHFSMFSDSTNIQVQTLNPKSVQTIFVGGEKIDLTETYKQFSHILKNQNREIKEIKLEHDDIIIAGDGVFTFASSDIINPFPRQFTNKTILEKSDIDYVLAHYQPIGSQAPYTRTVVFNVSPSCHDRRGLPFIIAAPDIETQEPVEVTSLDITFKGRTLSNYLKKLFSN
jgi:hypothetical protein